MKHFASVLLLVFFSSIFFKAQAQQQHFIYIQSEDRQPFAVVLNGKVYSSSDYGYVIVPKLTDGDYTFTVSFPMNKYPDQNFKCVIDKKDLGFKLENTTDKGWALENMQTQKVLANNSTASANNAFSNMLSDVVSDSNLAKKNLPVNNTDTTATSTNFDTTNIAAATTDTNTVAAATTPDTSNQATTQAGKSTGFVTDSAAQLQKISETKLDTGINMVFVDKAAADTIKVFVPNNDTSTNNTSVTTTDSVTNQQPSVTEASTLPAIQPDNSLPKTDTTATTLNESSSQTTDTTTHTAGNPFYKSSEQNTNTAAPENTNANVVNANTSVANENLSNRKTTNAVNELCIKMISDNDLDKIKRKMFVQSNDNDMVQTAVKYLSNKCLTTDQVKVLGSIFSSDDGRYNLYDALYKNVYDYGNYASLESQIIDPYYKRRFEAMLR